MGVFLIFMRIEGWNYCAMGAFFDLPTFFLFRLFPKGVKHAELLNLIRLLHITPSFTRTFKLLRVSNKRRVYYRKLLRTPSRKRVPHNSYLNRNVFLSYYSQPRFVILSNLLGGSFAFTPQYVFGDDWSVEYRPFVFGSSMVAKETRGKRTILDEVSNTFSTQPLRYDVGGGDLRPFLIWAGNFGNSWETWLRPTYPIELGEQREVYFRKGVIFSKLDVFSYSPNFDLSSESHLNHLLPLWGYFTLPAASTFQWFFRTTAAFEQNRSDLREIYSFPQYPLLRESKDNSQRFRYLFSEEEGILGLTPPSINFVKPPQFNLSARINGIVNNEGEDLRYDFSIPRVRFKPGYSRQWRKFRADFMSIFHLKFRYQTPLTKYISKVRLASITSRVSLFNMQLARVVHTAHLFWFYDDARTAIRRGLIYINGWGVQNETLYVTRGDLVQMSVSIQYYVSFFVSRQTWQRGVWRVRNVSNVVARRREKRLGGFDGGEGGDIPAYLEVDFFSLSCMVIFGGELVMKDLEQEVATRLPRVAYMYNWKYIN